MRPPPTTFEAIESVALRAPGRIALVDGDEAWTYQDLHLNLVRFSRLLHGLGVRRGQRVAVSRPNFRIQLLLLLACENLGAATSPFLGEGDPDAQALFGMVDWVFSERPQALPASVAFQPIDGDFIGQIARIDPHDPAPHPRVALGLDEVQRISRTSGSSGRSKFMLLSRQAQEHWLRIGTDSGGYTADSRLLLEGPLIMNAAFSRTCACLRLGAAVLSVPADKVPGTVFTHVWALPMRLSQWMDELPTGYVAPRTVQVATAGGFVTPQLRRRVRQVFGSVVSSGYGTNEVSGICGDLDETGTGRMLPGVDLRVLGPDGRELPDGEVGVIAVRTPAMAEGYVGEPEATKAAFQDGWFCSGDLGALVGPRLLRLAGRHDDLINLGGHKVPAAHLEARIRELVDVRDCAVLAINLSSVDITVGIALAIDPASPRQALAQRLRESLVPGDRSSARIVFVDELPRLSGGKLDRMALHRMFIGTGTDDRAED
jgi:long-chain acyl-CoA synthetase